MVKNKERYVLPIRCFLFFWFGNCFFFLLFLLFLVFFISWFFSTKRDRSLVVQSLFLWLCQDCYFFLFVRMQYPNTINPLFSTLKRLFQKWLSLKWLSLKWLSPEKSRPDKKIRALSLKKPCPKEIKR